MPSAQSIRENTYQSVFDIFFVYLCFNFPGNVTEFLAVDPYTILTASNHLQQLSTKGYCVGSNVVEASQTHQFIEPDLKSNVITIQEIQTWVEAIGFYDNNDFDSALGTFDNIPDTAKILFNCGVIHATLGEHNKAVGSSKGCRSWIEI